MSQQLTQEQIRQARHAGFANATAHLPENRRKKLETSYATQDARRERNISKFVNSIKGQA